MIDVSFVIEPGQAAGLVGYSGCGKSTIIQLIERFYDVEDGNGQVLIDDINVKDYNLYLLRKKIGLVSQEPVLFKRSVYENILYGRLDAKKDEVLLPCIGYVLSLKEDVNAESVEIHLDESDNKKYSSTQAIHCSLS